MSIDRGVDQEDVVHIHNGILAIKRKEIMAFAATWMDLETIMLAVRQEDTNIICYHLHVES